MTAKNIFCLAVILSFIPKNALAEDTSWQTEDYKKTLELRKYVNRGFVHENDTDWIAFGPAIIESCRSVVLGDGAGHYFVCEERDKTFPRVKEWLIGRFIQKLNCSPNRTVQHPAKRAPRIITLCASQTVHMEFTASPTLEQEKSMQDWLLSIPLTPKVLGSDEQEADREFATLKGLMSKQIL